MGKEKVVLIAVLALVTGLILLNIPQGRSAVDPEVTSLPYLVDHGNVSIKAGSLFAQNLQISTIEKSTTEKSLRGMGQVIALANHSASLGSNSLAWAELDPGLSHSLGINFASWKKVSPGLAVGVVWISSNYRSQIHPGEKLEVSLYGLEKTTTPGAILFIGKDNESSSRIPVIFRLNAAKNWYPGTNCAVHFPLLHGLAFHLSSTALLHEGANEYVMKEINPGQFVPENVSIIGESGGSTEVIGNFKPGDRVIQNGAILLKPVLQTLLNAGSKPEKISDQPQVL